MQEFPEEGKALKERARQERLRLREQSLHTLLKARSMHMPSTALSELDEVTPPTEASTARLREVPSAVTTTGRAGTKAAATSPTRSRDTSPALAGTAASARTELTEEGVAAAIFGAEGPYGAALSVVNTSRGGSQAALSTAHEPWKPPSSVQLGRDSRDEVSIAERRVDDMLARAQHAIVMLDALEGGS